MISSPTAVEKSSIGLLPRGFRFEGGRLQRFERRKVCMRRIMKVIGFFEFLTLRIHKFTLKIFFYLVDFCFQFRLGFENFPMLVFYTNRFKGLNKSKVTLLVTNSLVNADQEGGVDMTTCNLSLIHI